MKELELKDNVAIVTGGANGIGKAIAELFAKEGAKVVIADKDIIEAEDVAREICKVKGIAESEFVDVGEQDQVDCLVKNTLTLYGRIDILVNNAGITNLAPFLEYSLDDFNRVLKTNLYGTFLCTQRVAREMIKQDPIDGIRGSIINLSSPHAFRPQENAVAYVTSKHAIEGFTKTVGQELAPYGIKVNSIVPGATWSESTKQMFTPEVQKDLEETIPLRRIATPREIAPLALYLASRRLSGYCTMSSFAVDGGLTNVFRLSKEYGNVKVK